MFDTALDGMSLRMKARVDRSNPDALLDVSPGIAGLTKEIDAVQSLDLHTPHHYRHASPRVVPDEDISAWARHDAGQKTSAFACAQAICNAIHDEMTFDADATVVDTPYEEAIRMRRGVCQDFTRIAIAALRGIGIPAGYVSGFLRTIAPQGAEWLQGADAMHAWGHVWCGLDMGWVEFDPTNAMLAGEDHIVIARGRDYSDVSPVHGAMRMYGMQKTTQSVDVVALG